MMRPKHSEPIRLDDELSRRRGDIVSRRELLARRLEDGYVRIDRAAGDGVDVAAWEEFWIQLLREYEAVCDELRDAA